MLKDIVPSLCKGRPGHGLDVILSHKISKRPLLTEGVQFDLVHRRQDLVAEDQIAEPVGQEVTHPDGPDSSSTKKFLHGPPAAVVVSVGHVDQVEIQVIRSQILQCSVKRAQSFIIPRVLNPNLGGEE